jgi:DNA invertase Pin-like site-specific DNA recombinase
MAKYGYLFLTKNLSTKDEDLAWMKAFGCDNIIEEEGAQEKYRPQWRRMLTRLGKGDVIVVSKLSNALRGIRELGVFLDLCREYRVRLVSIHDRIDTGGELFPETGVNDVIDTISHLSSEATSVRRSEQGLKSSRKVRPNVKRGLRQYRDKTIISMYNAGHSIDDIWEASGYASRASVFRVLNRNGIQLNRGPHHGPLGKRKKRDE